MPQALIPPTQPHPAWVGFFDEILRLDAELTARRAVRRKQPQDPRRLVAATLRAESAFRPVFAISLGADAPHEIALRRCLVGSSPRFIKSGHFVVKSDRTISLKRTG